MLGARPAHALNPDSPEDQPAAHGVGESPSRHWDEVAARWWTQRDRMEAATAPVSERLVALARLAPGMRVLDVATGLGEPARTAARQIASQAASHDASQAAPGGLVVATDTSLGMLRRAAERAQADGVPCLAFAAADGTRPAFRGAAFDAVLCRFGLMALGPDPDALAASLAGLRALLRPGGRLAAAVWGPPEAVPSIAVPLTAARRVAGFAPPRAGERGPFRLGEPDAVPAALRAAGFHEVETADVTVRHRFEDVAACVDYCRATSGPIAALLREVPDLDPEAVWDAVAKALAPLAGPGGAVAMDNRAVCHAARA
jgi:SAM-dependent methyltransferase